MASLLDQYNKTLKRESISSGYPNNELPSSGFVSVRVKEETPIFTRRKMVITLLNDIIYLTVANGRMVMFLNNNSLFRFNLLHPDKRDDIYLDKFISGYQVSKIFLDPLGSHLFISVNSKTNLPSELYYLHYRWTRPRKIDKFKDHEITAIGFNNSNKNENMTGSILLGTSRGLIFEADFHVEGDKMFQDVLKQVFDVGGGFDNCPVTGIEFYTIKKFSNYVIIVTTTDRLYTFSEILDLDDKNLLLQNVFNSYLNIPEHVKHFIEFDGFPNNSKLEINYSLTTKVIRGLGWLRESGIFYGEINPDANTLGSIVSNENIPYPEQDSTIMQTSSKTKPVPLSFELTDFHVLLLYSDHVSAVSLLNYETVYEEYFTEQFGKLLSITKDVTMGSIYVYTSKSIFRYNINNEHRNAWRMYIDKNEFELAKKYCGDNPAHMDIVLVKQAELLFNQKSYSESALIYSRTQTSFEEVCLKFLDISENDAIMIFLKNRLEKLENQDKTQITMLVVWMVELYLTEIARCVDNVSRLTILQQEYDDFIKIPRVVECMRNNRSAIYELMASHADNHNLTKLTTVNRDFESVLNQHINQNKFLDALNVLKGQNKPDLYYKYCPILMENIPKETISAIINQSKHLDIIKLLPTLVSIDSESHVMEVIRYLEFNIYSMSCFEQSIHNYLIKLYGKYQNEKMLLYLENQGKDPTMVYYDIYYALRVCHEHNLYEACVFLQCLLEMWLPAVELSLKVNSKLAQQTASQPKDKSLRRKLWLKIAESKIKGKDNVDEAIELMKECDLLKIEDLLPFFSDFQKIDNFKEVICDALKEYNIKIQEQRKDMEESAKSAEKVRNELQSFRNRSITIVASEQCSICEVYLFLKPFFIFPCGHKIHSDCLEKSIMTYQTQAQNQKLLLLKYKLNAISIDTTQQSYDNLTSLQINHRDSDKTTKEQIKNEIENVLASDCFFCGEYMIESIDKPFIDDWDNVNHGWD